MKPNKQKQTKTRALRRFESKQAEKQRGEIISKLVYRNVQLKVFLRLAVLAFIILLISITIIFAIVS